MKSYQSDLFKSGISIVGVTANADMCLDAKDVEDISRKCLHESCDLIDDPSFRGGFNVYVQINLSNKMSYTLIYQMTFVPTMPQEEFGVYWGDSEGEIIEDLYGVDSENEERFDSAKLDLERLFYSIARQAFDREAGRLAQAYAVDEMEVAE